MEGIWLSTEERSVDRWTVDGGGNGLSEGRCTASQSIRAFSRPGCFPYAFDCVSAGKLPGMALRRTALNPVPRGHRSCWEGISVGCLDIMQNAFGDETRGATTYYRGDSRASDKSMNRDLRSYDRDFE